MRPVCRACSWQRPPQGVKVRGKPTATLLEVHAEAIRWEREGLPGVARGRSYSFPSAFGLWYGVQCGSCLAPFVTSPGLELDELKELLKRQQEQLNQLTQTLASLQKPWSHSRPPCSSSLICWRCQQPGHFARECDGERVPPLAHAGSATGLSSNMARPSCSAYQPENWSPLSCRATVQMGSPQAHM